MSKVALANGGVAQLYVKHGTTILPSGKERKITTVKVVLPDGTELTGDAICHNKDQFCKRTGRKLAFKKLIESDNVTASDKAVQDYSCAGGGCGKSRTVEAGSLRKAAQAHYKLSRLDRTAIFGQVCPEFFRNTPERKKAREMALYARLTEKYGKATPTAAKPKTVKINQKFGDIKGATVVGAVIGNVG